MKPEKQQLLDDLLGGEGREDTTLLVAGKILRGRRQWRVACRAFALITLATATVLLVAQNRQRPTLVHISPPTAEAPAARQARSLTDAELLALFPDTPVGLATLTGGKKLLLFPRPGDAAKFITRL